MSAALRRKAREYPMSGLKTQHSWNDPKESPTRAGRAGHLAAGGSSWHPPNPSGATGTSPRQPNPRRSPKSEPRFAQPFPSAEGFGEGGPEGSFGGVPSTAFPLLHWKMCFTRGVGGAFLSPVLARCARCRLRDRSITSPRGGPIPRTHGALRSRSPESMSRGGSPGCPTPPH